MPVRTASSGCAEKRHPNVWFDNVELNAACEVGCEPVQYVSNIYNYYLFYRSPADYLEATGKRVVEG